MNAMQEALVEEYHPPPHILVMDDELSVAKGLELILTEEGYEVDLAMTGHDALDTFGKKEIDLLVADLRLPDIDGMDVIRQVKERRPETGVVVITGYASVYSAVDAMRMGASDYLAKPFTDDQIKASVGEALKGKRAERVEEGLARPKSEEEKLIQKREVVRALNRTAEDEGFWKDLMANGSSALGGYTLSNEAKAAIASGDLRWLNREVGELTQKQLKFIYKRLEREAW
jgi:FixJ family two-component response regulator